MAKAPNLLLHLALLLCAACVFLLDVTDAHAQSRNCQNLSRTLAQIERSGSFRNSGGSADVRRLEREVQQAESRYVRDGCNAAAKRGDRLSSECRTQARTVLRARETLEKAKSRADSSNAIAQQREAVLQEMARFNCNANSNATVSRNRGGNLFEQLFGGSFGGNDDDEKEVGDGLATRGEDFRGYAGYNTVRTVCVRKADGFFWPVSYSTLVEYAPNDLTQCQAQCPGQDVDLYYYSNPGQEPQQMVNLAGAPYTSLPTAFAYRTTYDPANHCKAQVTYGGISLATLADGTSRAVIAYGEATFPLPLRDPRRTPTATVIQAVAVTYVDVPLPRPRPAAPGEAPKPVVVQQAANDVSRVVMFGDKRVRVVGPDTPYAPTAATGT